LVPVVQSLLGRAYIRQQEYGPAQIVLQQSLQALTDSTDPAAVSYRLHTERALTAANAGVQLQAAIDTYGPNSPQVAALRLRLGLALRSIGDEDSAQREFQMVLAFIRHSLQQENADFDATLVVLTLMRQYQGATDEASMLGQVLALLTGSNHNGRLNFAINDLQQRLRQLQNPQNPGGTVA
jgi:hypothetical protein